MDAAEKNIDPYGLCEQLDIFLSGRGRSLFPEGLSLERRYLTDPLVRADPGLLQRVLFVMLSSLFTTSSAERGGTVKITVSDHNHGTALVALSYESASKAVAAVPDDEDLAAAVDLLRRFGGAISFSGRSENSATIRFTVPTCDLETPEIEEGEPDLSIDYLRLPGLSNLRVLIADDEAPIRDLLGTIVSDAGISAIDYARNGEEACVKALETHYDLIFMDITMPVMSGREAFSHIMSARPDSRIVLVTGFYNEDLSPGTADSLGFFGYIKKPFNISQIRSMLEKALAG